MHDATLSKQWTDKLVCHMIGPGYFLKYYDWSLSQKQCLSGQNPHRSSRVSGCSCITQKARFQGTYKLKSIGSGLLTKITISAIWCYFLSTLRFVHLLPFPSSNRICTKLCNWLLYSRISETEEVLIYFTCKWSFKGWRTSEIQ